MAAEERKKAGLEGPPRVALLQNAFVTESPEEDWPMVRDGSVTSWGCTRAGVRAPT